MTQLITEVCTITPEMAKMYLENCSRINRSIDKTRVNFYSKQMKEGRWEMNGETLIFSDKNVLLNGYHRMNAVVAANVPVQFLVVRNIDEESFKTIDTGKPRTGGDAYTMANIPNASRVSSIVRRFIIFTRSRTSLPTSASNGQAYGITNAEMLEEYYKQADLFQEIGNYSAALNAKIKLYTITEIGSVISFLHIALGYDKAFIDNFFNVLFQYNVDDLTPRRDFIPCKLLRERLIQAALSQQRLTSKYKLLLLAKAWYLWKDNKDLRVLKIGDTEDIRFE